MSRNLVSDNSLFNVFAIGQSEVFLGCDVAKHRCTCPTRQCGTNRTGNMIVAWGNVGDQRAKYIKWSAMANFNLLLDVHLYLVHRDVTGTLHHNLSTFAPTLFA